MTQRDGMEREEGSGWGTHVNLWRIHFDIRQNQYNIVKLKNKIKLKLVHVKKILLKKCRSIYLLPQGILVTWFVVVVQSLTVSDSLPPHELQHARFLCPSLFPRVSSNSYPLSRWCHPTISSCVVHSSPCPQSFLASGHFQWVGSLHQVAKVLEFPL